MIISKKPSRRDLLKIVGELQDRIGRAQAAYLNDRGPERAKMVLDNLEEAFEICVQATSFDAPT